MRKKNGQALVEFVILMPLLLWLILGFVDFGTILYQRYHLESDLDLVSELYRNQKTEEILSYGRKNNLNISYLTETNSSMITIQLSKKIKLVTPGAQLIFQNPFPIEVSKVVYHA